MVVSVCHHLCYELHTIDCPRRMAWMLDRRFVCTSQLPTAIDDKEVTVELPVTQAIYESGVGDLTGCQTLE